MSYPIIRSSFTVLCNDVDPNVMTDKFGLHPTEYGIKGERRQNGRPNVPYSFWMLEVKAENIVDINESLNDLMDLLWPQKDDILFNLKKYHLEANLLTSIIYFDEKPLLNIDATNLNRLAFFNVGFDLDLYNYGEK